MTIMTPIIETESPKSTLWLEVTNFCNLRCGHCYNSSSPQEPLNPSITPQRYRRLLAEAAAMGFQHVQFIGGEPMFYPHIHELVQEACGLGFQEVELFSNLTTVAPWLLATPKPRIVIATSFYSDDPAVHDAVTETPGSFQRTVASIRTLIAAGYTLRAGFIEMETNAGYFDRTVAFLKTLGVKDVDHDKARQFGRADPGEAAPDMAQLCGQCSGSNLSIDVEGRVSGCIMSKPWAFGNIQDDSLEILYDSPDRQKFVRDLEEIVRDRGPVEIHGCEPCAPAGCAPCAPPPWCGPQR